MLLPSDVCKSVSRWNWSLVVAISGEFVEFDECRETGSTLMQSLMHFVGFT